MAMPWMFNRTMTRDFYCPWSSQTVTLRFLTWDGRHPLGLIGCTEKNCDLKCLNEPDRIAAIFPQEEEETPAPTAPR